MMASILRLAASLPLRLAAGCLFVMMVLTFGDVIGRSVLSAPIPGAAELTELLLAAVVFLAMPATCLFERHISVDLLDGFLPRFLIRWRDAAMNLLFGVLLVWPVMACWTSGLRILGYGEVTLYLRLSVGGIILFITAGLAAGAAAMVLRGVCLIVNPALVGSMEPRRGDA
ncbi:TRAP transporter small permease [Stappia sp.]|uniref:TRAP transporter small permease n=1 Tax=Stappia sp. TaxID=1870903 RepID=UPI003C7D3100